MYEVREVYIKQKVTASSEEISKSMCKNRGWGKQEEKVYYKREHEKRWRGPANFIGNYRNIWRNNKGG